MRTTGKTPKQVRILLDPTLRETSSTRAKTWTSDKGCDPKKTHAVMSQKGEEAATERFQTPPYLNKKELHELMQSGEPYKECFAKAYPYTNANVCHDGQKLQPTDFQRKKAPDYMSRHMLGDEPFWDRNRDAFGAGKGTLDFLKKDSGDITYISEVEKAVIDFRDAVPSCFASPRTHKSCETCALQAKSPSKKRKIIANLSQACRNRVAD